jgi:FkbM family methyltransferase
VCSILSRGLGALFRRKVIYLAGHRVEMPASHELPKIRAKCPHYEGEIARLAEFLFKAEKRLVMADVGANVGDTVALLRPQTGGDFLCIEASPTFFAFLERNLRNFANVHCINALLTEPGDPLENGSVLELSGSAHVLDDVAFPAGSRVRRLTLDRLLSENSQFPPPNFLKIDTDGYDLKVLYGSAQLLKRSGPAIHFELSFRHWKEIGRTTWKEGADFLSANGYKECLLYDNLGYILDVDEFESPRILPVMESYASRRAQFYLNVITFHSSSPHWASFKVSELSRAFDSDRIK